MDENSHMFFGRYKGWKLKSIPASYFIYLLDEGKATGQLKAYIEANIEKLRQSDMDLRFKKSMKSILYKRH